MTAIISAAVVVLVVVVLWRFRFRDSRPCEPGTTTIDMADFVTRYSAYSMEFGATINDKSKLEGKIAPVQLQQMSEALQSANEFRKTLVAGYNACAISKSRFDEYAGRFQALDGLSRQITALSTKEKLGAAEQNRLSKLVNNYVQQSQELSRPTQR